MSASTIWKFPLKITDDQAVPMPKNAEILCVQTQNDQPCLWAIVDPKAKPQPRHIVIHGTGHPCRMILAEYIGTFQIQNGRFVFHVFEDRK